MIPTQAEPPEWTSDHAKTLRDFLHSDTGRLALDWVEHNSPTLLDGSDVNRTLVSCGEARGFTRAVSELISLTYEKPVSTTTPAPEFPDLDDDKQWNSETDERPREPKQ